MGFHPGGQTHQLYGFAEFVCRHGEFYMRGVCVQQALAALSPRSGIAGREWRVRYGRFLHRSDIAGYSISPGHSETTYREELFYSPQRRER